MPAPPAFPVKVEAAAPPVLVSVAVSAGTAVVLVPVPNPPPPKDSLEEEPESLPKLGVPVAAGRLPRPLPDPVPKPPVGREKEGMLNAGKPPNWGCGNALLTPASAMMVAVVYFIVIECE